MKNPRRFPALFLLAFFAVALLAASVTSAMDFSYSEVGFGDPMAAACAAAAANIVAHCDVCGLITTTPLACSWIQPLNGEPPVRICRCRATTTYCAIQNPNPLFP